MFNEIKKQVTKAMTATTKLELNIASWEKEVKEERNTSESFKEEISELKRELRKANKVITEAFESFNKKTFIECAIDSNNTNKYRSFWEEESKWA